MSGLNQHTANVPIPKKVQPFESVTLLLKLYNMLTKEKCLELGFKELSHFTVGNSLTYLINRDRYLSISSVGTPNEMLFIYSADYNNPKEITDIITLHNYDYEGYLSEEKLLNLINWFKPDHAF